MKKMILYILSVATLTLSFTTAKAQNDSADIIIQKHIDAVGGRDNWNKITSLKMIGSVNVQDMKISITTTAVQDKAARTDINIMGTKGYIIVTSKEGWSYLPAQGMDKVTPMTADQVKIQQGQLDLKDRLLNKSATAGAKFAGRDTINNIPCLKVKIADEDGGDKVLFFDAVTYYLVRSQRKMQIRGEDEEITVTFSNFQKQPEGIVIAMTTTSPMMNDAEIVYKSVEINKPVSDEIFKPGPGDKK